MFIRTRYRSLLLLALISQTVNAAQLFSNGDFELPGLSPWEDMSEGSDTVTLMHKGRCFGGLDTRMLAIRGEKAAALRTHGVDSMESGAVLRSEPFPAGNGFAFIALVASQNSLAPEHHPQLRVEILDARNDKTIVSQVFSPDRVALTPNCPAQGSSMHRKPKQFSAHYFSTQAYSGKNIRIQFSLSSDPGASSSFIFIDQVVYFEQGEQPLFYSRPYAQAGMQRTRLGTPYLSSEGSFDPDQKPSALSYTWYVNNREYRLTRPCLRDYDQGNYQAVLYVNDGHYAMSDDTQFFISASGNPTNDEESECQRVSPGAAETRPVTVDKVAQPEPVFSARQQPALTVKSSEPQTLPIAENTLENAHLPTPERIADTPLTRNAYALKGSGILWQPTAANNGQLRVVTPAHFPQQMLLLLTAQGEQQEEAAFIERTDEGFAYGFKLAGSAYPLNSILRVGHTDYLVMDPASEN